MILISENRKARFNFFILNTIESGIVLTSTEVKSLRKNKANLSESYVIEKSGEMWIQNLHIPEFNHGNRFNHNPKRLKKLLLHKKEINKFIGSIKKDNATIIPLSIYFNDKGKIKIKISLATGKKKHDKRETIKQREWDRTKNRIK
ncbi:MAG: SsrA-binding protein SmpB [Rickettsiaceae bacterium H1]|nr:SsrA-binding protein SmpB [Rickettsiaceae bacterium H1]